MVNTDEIEELGKLATEAGYEVKEITEGDRIVFYFVKDDYRSANYPNEVSAWLAAGKHAKLL